MAVKVTSQFFGAFSPDQYWEDRLNRAPLDKLTRLVVPFAPIIQKPDKHYSIDFQEPYSSVERVNKLLGRVKQLNPSAQVHLCVSANNNNPSSFQDATNDPNFALNAVEFMTKHGFTGLNLDWETNIDTNSVSQLATNLYQEFKSNQYLLTMDGGSFVPTGLYDMGVMQKCLSFYAMTYGVNCPYQSGIASYTSQGFPIQQIHIGIDSEYTSQFGMDTPGDDGSIAAKANFAITNGMEGGFEWRLENDDCCLPNKPYYPTFQCGMQLWSSMTGEVLPKDKDGKFIVKSYEPPKKPYCLLV